MAGVLAEHGDEEIAPSLSHTTDIILECEAANSNGTAEDYSKNNSVAVDERVLLVAASRVNHNEDKYYVSMNWTRSVLFHFSRILHICRKEKHLVY